MLELSAASTEYVRVPITAREAGTPVDPTGDTVHMAFLTGSSAPGAEDWQTASWETDATTTPTVYYARCLVGPDGTTTLTAGLYSVWVRVIDNPEEPVMRAGAIRITA